MKKVNSIVPWLLLISILLTTTCFATINGNVSFNGVAIRVNGEKVSSAGDTYKVENGSDIPFSMLYQDEQGGGTTFVSLRKMSELLGVDIGWDNTTSEVLINKATPQEPNEIPQNGTYRIHENGATFQFHYTNGIQDHIVDVSLPSGATYHGECVGTAITGQGTMIFPNEGLYSGGFLNGEKHGDGTFLWNDGPRYIGQWANDQMNGDGIYYYNSGMTQKLVGTFSNNLPDGSMKYYDEAGVCYDTVWSQGVCITSYRALYTDN